MSLTDNQKAYIRFLTDKPAEFGKLLGFDRLKALHNGWMREMITGTEDMTLLAHRLSYKTTCVSVVLAIYAIAAPSLRLYFLRKTDADVKEIILQTQKILNAPVTKYIARQIWGLELQLTEESATKITTNLVNDVKGASQITAQGVGSSITGKHFDRIFTDDIVNISDRISKAERDHTKLIYMELQNIRNPGGRIINTGTPWHKDDAIGMMPNVQMYDCYSTGLMDEETIAAKRAGMTPPLFAANYELKHIASEGALFTTSPVFTDEENVLRDGIAHIDAAYGGSDASALTLARKRGDKIFILGKRRECHIDNCLDEYLAIAQSFMCAPVYCEDNADKGYLRKEIIRRGGMANGYHEQTNKYIKISTYAKKWWENIVFHRDTDPEYINEILDYTIDAEHDDSPDSLASIVRKLDKPERVSLL